MPVCRYFTALFALFALLLGAACGDRNHGELPAETDEPLYVQGVQLKRQGRNSEALNSFLKLVEKRGLRDAAESHLEVGLIYLDHSKDPIRAIYHFQQYLELQPNSKQAPYVRGRVDVARREFAKTLLLPNGVDDPSVRVPFTEDMEKLRRENAELRAEIQVLRGGGAQMPNRSSRMITVPPEESRTTEPATPTPAPVIDPSMATSPSTARTPTPSLNLPTQNRPTTTKQRPTQAQTPTTRAPAASGRTHTVQRQESLYSIARRYNVRVEDITRANGITDPNKVPAGTVLKIP